MTGIELVSVLSLLDGEVDPHARAGIHWLLERYLNDTINPPLSLGIPPHELQHWRCGDGESMDAIQPCVPLTRPKPPARTGVGPLRPITKVRR